MSFICLRTHLVKTLFNTWGRESYLWMSWILSLDVFNSHEFIFLKNSYLIVILLESQIIKCVRLMLLINSISMYIFLSLDWILYLSFWWYVLHQDSIVTLVPISKCLYFVNFQNKVNLKGTGCFHKMDKVLYMFSKARVRDTTSKLGILAPGDNLFFWYMHCRRLIHF